MVKTRRDHSESESSTFTAAGAAVAKSPTRTTSKGRVSASIAASPPAASSRCSTPTTTSSRHSTTKKTTPTKKSSKAKASLAKASVSASSTRYSPLRHIPRTGLIKGTSHIHFHENIRLPSKSKKARKGQRQQPPQDIPEVVKMATGTLYIYRGEGNKRVVFVRNK